MGKNLKFMMKKSVVVVLSLMLVVSLGPQVGFASNSAQAVEVSLEAVDRTNAPTLRSDLEVQQYLLSNNDGKYSKNGISNQPRLLRKNTDTSGVHYMYQQTYNGIPVYGKYANVSLDSRSRLSYVKNEFSNDIVSNLRTTTPSISGEQAISTLLVDVQNQESYEIVTGNPIEGVTTYKTTSELIIYPFKYKTRLAYEIKLSYMFPQANSWVGYVDAISGDVIEKYSTNNHLSDANAAVGSGSGYEKEYNDLNVYHDVSGELGPVGQYHLIDVTKDMFTPGDNSGVIRTQQWQAVSDSFETASVTSDTYEFQHQDAVDAHYNSGIAYDFYLETFGRNSFDNEGRTVTSIVYDFEEDNAYYVSGLDIIFYGRGSGTSDGFDCVTCSQDIVIHEFTHGVTQYMAGLEYRFQSGALNESISDIMSAVADTDGDEWLNGEETGDYIRNMENPPDRGQPAHMDDYFYTGLEPWEDNGGVHTNSGIPNHAAYLMATGIDNLSMDGRAILGMLTYQVLTYLNPTSDFQDARDAYIQAAQDYEEDHSILNDSVVNIVKSAWAMVGLPEGQYYNTNIKSFDVTESTSSAVPIIDEYWAEVLFFVPYATNFSSITPTIVTSNGADYYPKTALNFNNNDKSAGVRVENDDYYMDWTLYAIEEPILNYSSTALTEAIANDGSFTSSVTVNLVNDVFTGSNGEDYLGNSKVIIGSVPAGLTATATKLNNTQVLVSLAGQATSHAAANNVPALQIAFQDHALKDFYIDQLTNATKTVSINFSDPAVAAVGGGGGGFFAPPVTAETDFDPTTGVTVTPPDATSTTTDDGQSELIFDLTEDDLNNGFEQLKSDSTDSTVQVVKISITQDGDLLSVNLPAAAIQAGALSSPNAVIVIETKTGTYELPVSLLDLAQIAKSLGVKVEDLTVTISMDQVSKEIDQALSENATKSKLQLVGDAIDFSITVSSGTSNVEVKEFGGKYVNRSILVPGQLSPTSATVLLYNPETNRFTFVPAVFQAEGGQTRVTFKRNGNSIYTVAKFSRTFTDVSNHWAAADIALLASKTIISGYTESEFEPDRTITRAEFATILTRALGLSLTGKKANFTDVSADAWYADAVAAAVNAKLVSGYEDRTFRPNANITREQMAVMIAQALSYAEKTSTSSSDDISKILESFKDEASISAWARSAVGIAADARIVSGFASGNFDPSKQATRAEAAIMVRRLLDHLGFINK